MATNEQILDGHVSLTREREQRTRVIIEEASLANAATTTFTHPSLASGEKAIPPRAEVYTHNGGLENANAETWNITDGDTLEFQVSDPGNPNQKVGSGADLNDPDALFTKVTVALTGLTGGAATAAEVVASLNADAEFSKWAYAAVVNATFVTVFPKGLQGQLRVTGGSAQTEMGFPAGTIDNGSRTFTKQDPSSWGLAWDAGTGEATITNNSGGAVSKVSVHLTYF